MAWSLFSGRALLFPRSDLRLDTDRELRAALENRLILLLFSAPRCPRCRGFEPRLRRFWRRLTDPACVERPQQVRLVYLGQDRSEREHSKYLRNVPRTWMALPYGDQLASDLAAHFGVSELPTVVVLAPIGAVPFPPLFPYSPSPHSDLSARFGVSELPTVVVLAPSGDLSARFGVSELPTVVVLAPSGAVLVPNAVQEIAASGDSGPSCFQSWREAAELLDRNFQEREDSESFHPKNKREKRKRIPNPVGFPKKVTMEEQEKEEEEENKDKEEEEEEEEEQE
ncbi:hypothetical protein HGM15179_019061 [Zosterops borbonicus]|uniref:Thioredoxin-like fold domain-containing protein n=1 Tax=Zosterops borbonicus TaxID=364589 RepID=A0A8K1D9E7_9PASS|nr:hypothetical protein HGM15179_019061 [Zosterops borbonicus]